ncbi:hypothetical protein RFI_16020 [Reticulomyxa filosa]|uniref:Uncharacterized protein n=1 Tax=Reticulomyxa filosa TaxID=46433 RepID=X6N560_RETFI|nr:hypothetical protein RFI_16020 [Reticulomyxa filosa]|eukprot:ETO21181.1 hypothetical protein RFI_16020 [Reticulomyxa filosa]
MQPTSSPTCTVITNDYLWVGYVLWKGTRITYTISTDANGQLGPVLILSNPHRTRNNTSGSQTLWLQSTSDSKPHTLPLPTACQSKRFTTPSPTPSPDKKSSNGSTNCENIPNPIRITYILLVGLFILGLFGWAFVRRWNRARQEGSHITGRDHASNSHAKLTTKQKKYLRNSGYRNASERYYHNRNDADEEPINASRFPVASTAAAAAATGTGGGGASGAAARDYPKSRRRVAKPRKRDDVYEKMDAEENDSNEEDPEEVELEEEMMGEDEEDEEDDDLHPHEKEPLPNEALTQKLINRDKYNLICFTFLQKKKKKPSLSKLHFVCLVTTKKKSFVLNPFEKELVLVLVKGSCLLFFFVLFNN